MPTNVLLKNIIVSPDLGNESQERKSLFMVDFHDFYQKNGFEANDGKIVLKVKNSLFLFDEMENSISIRLIQKYAETDVLEIITRVFRKCSAFVRQVNSMRPRSEDSEQQLYSLIFQSGFAFRLAERMLKVRRVFGKRLRDKQPISHYDILEAV